jgi:hypothetical protein
MERDRPASSSFQDVSDVLLSGVELEFAEEEVSLETAGGQPAWMVC